MPEETEEKNPKGEFPIIPRHSHTGVDSPLVSFKELDDIRETRVTYDPGNIASATAELTNFTITGARLGDYVLVSAPYDLQTIGVIGYVSASNIVTLNLWNSGTAAINLASGVWKIKVMK